MGPYLTTPKREKETENGENSKVCHTLPNLPTLIGEIRSMRNVRLEKHNGGLTHQCN